jgi:23S rRNA (cytosine1962-C5)-methyltransferase
VSEDGAAGGGGGRGARPAGSAPPTLQPDDVRAPLEAALARRERLLAESAAEGTDMLRLLHGATEGLPGVTVDRYGDVVLVQTWRGGLAPACLPVIAEMTSAALGALPPATPLHGASRPPAPLEVVWNHRARGAGRYASHHAVEIAEAEGLELGLRFDARPRHRGLDPLLFLDFRAARRKVREAAGGLEVLNLFAYTCGIGVAAAAGGARHVLNVDFARSALQVGHDNAARNGVSAAFHTLEADCLPASRLLAGLPVRGRAGRKARVPRVRPHTFDLTILDPPRWATSAFGTVDVVGDYPTVFKPALLATRPGGVVLATHHVASVGWDDWVAVLHRAADKAGRPLASVTRIPVEEDFPSPDGQWPLKLAWCTLAP